MADTVMYLANKVAEIASQPPDVLGIIATILSIAIIIVDRLRKRSAAK